MPTYLSPGVYVEEIPSGSAPIAALSTSTAGFIGIVPDPIEIPISPVMIVTETFNKSDEQVPNEFNLTNFPVSKDAKPNVVVVDTPTRNTLVREAEIDRQTSDIDKKAKIRLLGEALQERQEVKVTYIVESVEVKNEVIWTIPEGTDLSNNIAWNLNFKKYPVGKKTGQTWKIKANGFDLTSQVPLAQIGNDDDKEIATVSIDSDLVKSHLESDSQIRAKFLNGNDTTLLPIPITVNYQVTFPKFNPAAAGEVKLCTNFNEFKKYFGDFSTDTGQKQLAHAVYGFFNNGGSRCYVSRVANETDIIKVLEKFEAIDEIAIVAAPGIVDTSTRSAIVTHCQNMGDRFAILDCKQEKVTDGGGRTQIKADNVDRLDKPDNSDYAAYYFPWIKVLDPVKRILNPNAKEEELLISYQIRLSKYTFPDSATTFLTTDITTSDFSSP